MHSLFNPENKFWNFMGKVTDVCCMSFLWLLTSLPIITVGASTAAFYSFTLDAVCDEEGSVWQSYFSAFRENFKKSTLIWLGQLLCFVLLTVNLYAAWNFYAVSGVLGLGLLSLAACGMLLFLGIGCYVYPVLVCYDFPLKKILADSFIMAVRDLHVTVSVLVIFLAVGVCIYQISGLFFFWIGLGIFFSSYLIWGVFLKNAGIKPERKQKKKKVRKLIDPHI